MRTFDDMITLRPPCYALTVCGLFFVFGCKSGREAETVSPPRVISSAPKQEVSANYTIADHSVYAVQHFGGLRVFDVGDHRFSTIDEFIPWVTSLPKGTELYWNSGCAYYHRVPLKDSSMTMDQFKALCVDHAIKFAWVCGY